MCLVLQAIQTLWGVQIQEFEKEIQLRLKKINYMSYLGLLINDSFFSESHTWCDSYSAKELCAL